MSEKADWELQESELAMRYGRYGKYVISAISLLDPDQVNYQLVADLICSDTLYQMRGGNHGPGGYQQGRYGSGQGGNGQNWQAQQQRARGGSHGLPGMQGCGQQMQMTQQQQMMMMVHDQQQRSVQQGMGLPQGMTAMGRMGMQNLQDVGAIRQGMMQGMRQARELRRVRLWWTVAACVSNSVSDSDLSCDCHFRGACRTVGCQA